MQINLPRYVSFYLYAMLGMLALSVALSFGFSKDMPPGLTTILPAMIAAYFEGVRQARERKAMLSSGAAWGAALAMTAAAFVFTACLYVVQLAIPGVASALTDVSRGFLYGLVFFVLVVVFLTNRVFLHHGMKTELAKAASAEKED
jgi:phosphoglycerol transferase MdoB-like AlkP superfamily enzyme